MPAAGIKDDLLAVFESVEDLGFGAAGAANLYGAQLGAAIGKDEGGPLVATPEESAGK